MCKHLSFMKEPNRLKTIENTNFFNQYRTLGLDWDEGKSRTDRYNIATDHCGPTCSKQFYIYKSY